MILNNLYQNQEMLPQIIDPTNPYQNQGMIRQIIDRNNPLPELSNCGCGLIYPYEFCERCGSPYITFLNGEIFRVVDDEETAWRCVSWLASRDGSYQSTPFTNSRGAYRVVSEVGHIFREKRQPNGSWIPDGWYTVRE